MNRFKVLLGLVLVAAFAFGATATATAAPIKVLNSNHEAVKTLKLSGHSVKETKLQVLEGFAEVKCPEILIEAELLDEQLGDFHFHWHKCTTSAGGTCTGLGDESGLILALGTFHLVEDKLGTGAELGAGILFLVEHLHFACKTIIGTTLVLVLGEVLCLISPLTLSSSVTVKCENNGKNGDPGETVYWNDLEQKEVKMGENGLLSSENEGSERMSAEVGEGVATTTNGEQVELMD